MVDFEDPRTNNYVEDWYSRLKKVVGKPHPNIFELIEIIKKEGATTQMKMQICESGGLTVEQLASMNIWKHLSIKLDYKLFCTDALCM